MLEIGDRVYADFRALTDHAARIGTSWARDGLERIETLLVGERTRSLTQVEALKLAVDDVEASPLQAALLTAPIDKFTASREGLTHPGHTEYLMARAGVAQVLMTMVGPTLRVGLVTTHVPLRDVAAGLTQSRIVGALHLLIEGLSQHLCVAKPRVGVLGLNPHAGERGLLGREEIEIVEPAILQVQDALGVRDGERPAIVRGPLPADTAFHRHASGEFDALLAMYHDQALAPFKLAHFHDGVNVTFGLPYLRCSPDHGTASDIVGRGVADPRSFYAAASLARGHRLEHQVAADRGPEQMQSGGA